MQWKKKEFSDDFDAGNINSFFGNETELEGTLRFDGIVRIDGKFTGEIITDGTLILGSNSEVHADLEVGSVVIKGKVRGSIKASRKIEIGSGSELLGDVVTNAITIEEGASFKGKCEMMSNVSSIDAEDTPVIRREEDTKNTESEENSKEEKEA